MGVALHVFCYSFVLSRWISYWDVENGIDSINRAENC
jgi:hypothetical protein